MVLETAEASVEVTVEVTAEVTVEVMVLQLAVVVLGSQGCEARYQAAGDEVDGGQLRR